MTDEIESNTDAEPEIENSAPKKKKKADDAES